MAYNKAPKKFGKAGKLGKLGKKDPRRALQAAGPKAAGPMSYLQEDAKKEAKKAKKAKVHIDTDGDGVADTTVEGTAVEE